MPRFRPTSPLGLAFGAYHIWRRLPPAQRRMVLKTARTHGPKVAAALLAKRKSAARPLSGSQSLADDPVLLAAGARSDSPRSGSRATGGPT